MNDPLNTSDSVAESPASVEEASGKHARSFYIAGLGASAGGLEALTSFFDAMPADSGVAFVVVQHLAPDFKSQMAELLSRRTRMPVRQVEDGDEVEPNRVYLIPPARCLKIFNGKLLLSDHDAATGPNLPIDLFFRSLAHDQGEHAIAIGLSGTGSDGTRGIRAIKEAGGMVMVQDEQSAKFDGMPGSIIATGLADFILTAAEMPAALLKFTSHPLVARVKGARLQPEETTMHKIAELIRAQSGIDFSGYKQSTVVRRIERRMGVAQVERLDDYLEFLHAIRARGFSARSRSAHQRHPILPRPRSLCGAPRQGHPGDD